MTRELHPLLRHALQMRCRDFSAKGADVRVAEIVNVDEDDVRLFRREQRAQSGEKEAE